MVNQTLMETAKDSRPIDLLSRVYTLLSRSFSFPNEELHRLFRKEGMAEEMEEMMGGCLLNSSLKGSPLSPYPRMI